MRQFLRSILRSKADPDEQRDKDYCWTHKKIEKPQPPKK